MSFTFINAALVEAYQDANLGLSTAYEGQAFTPVEDEPWAAVVLLPSPVVAESLGDDGTDRHTGSLQIDLNEPLGSGNSGLLGYADTLRAYFTAGRQLSHAGQPVLVNSCSRTALKVVDGWLRISVIVTWTAWTTR